MPPGGNDRTPIQWEAEKRVRKLNTQDPSAQPPGDSYTEMRLSPEPGRRQQPQPSEEAASSPSVWPEA